MPSPTRARRWARRRRAARRSISRCCHGSRRSRATSRPRGCPRSRRSSSFRSTCGCQLDAARQRRANALARLDLLRREGDALATEAGALAGAQASLSRVGPAAPNRNPDGSPCRTDRALADDFRRDGQACRERIVIALLRYANAWTTGELPRAEAQVRARALGHAAVVDASVNALAQWESLVKVPLDQLVAYHADGTRPQDVAALLSALGLGAVAATAHR